MSRPVLFFLPGLGMSAQVAGPLAQHLRHLDVVGIDLPGFGAEPMGASTIDDLAEHVTTRIAAEVAARAPERWGLIGHSMGGKVASVVAARTLAGRAPLFGLAGVVLLAGSPPSPEPIDDVRRSEMLSWAERPGGLSAADARMFLDANRAGLLSPELDDLALTAVRGSDPEAWTAWLTRGSREDQTEQVGRLDLPALLLAGAEDGDLGEAAQRELNGPFYPRTHGYVQVIAGAAHLLMLEQPAAVGAAIAEWWRTHADRGPSVPPDYAAVLASPRTARRTRAALAQRAVADDPGFEPRALSEDQVLTLGQVAARVVPQGGLDASYEIDLAARVDAQLADGIGDGWRREGQPGDVVAYRRGLDALSAAGFADLDDAGQDEQLRALGEDPWFEDSRTDLVRAWLAHPATMARIGFDGVANGGDDRRQQGFTLVALGQREAWEPQMLPAVRRVAP